MRERERERVCESVCVVNDEGGGERMTRTRRGCKERGFKSTFIERPLLECLSRHALACAATSIKCIATNHDTQCIGSNRSVVVACDHVDHAGIAGTAVRFDTLQLDQCKYQCFGSACCAHTYTHALA
jgi:hypothetical protein